MESKKRKNGHPLIGKKQITKKWISINWKKANGVFVGHDFFCMSGKIRTTKKLTSMKQKKRKNGHPLIGKRQGKNGHP
ncbi:MAG: hypothetical protein WBO16_10125 [Gammaproteobacteria bacterium]